MIILKNARIYTQDPDQPFAEALTIDNNRFIACGSNQDMVKYEATGAIIEDAQGAFIIPGLTDAHIHLEEYAAFLAKVDCETPTRQECLDRVAKKAKVTPKGQWILGHGWNQHSWQEGFGNATMLDSISSEHPIYLTAKSLHAGWCNSLALRIMGIDAHTPDPSGGKFGRDDQGNPDGILFEYAMNVLEQHLPQKSQQQTIDEINAAQKQLWQYGITGIHDFDGKTCYQALQTLHKDRRLSLRVLKSIRKEDLTDWIRAGLVTGFGDNMLRIGSVKLFADGALGPRTAAMFSPYQNEPENSGMLFLTSQQVLETGMLAVQSGVSLAIHAIGDRANHEVLDGYALLREFEKKNNLPLGRHRMEHVQVLYPEDIARLHELKIIASVQPIHIPSDFLAADRWWGDRAAFAYAFRSLLDSGTALAFGSDAPVESPNPFWGLHAAVNRTRWDGEPSSDGWHPEQKLTLAESLHGFTIGTAYAAGAEDHLGRIMPGYLADLVVLPQNPFEVDAQSLRDMQPLATMVDGKWVWKRKE
jgi:predicted amidohydrolase YtcJ